jgi:NAD(P)-dependent dehydrogenase (short-subunit alcohol dehydrogenase family)
MPDPTVIITGASGNLGRALVSAFGARNANLALVDRHLERLAATFGPEDARRTHVAADLLNVAAVDEAVNRAAQRFGRIDVLCNIAGGFRMGAPVHETPDSDWTFLFDINVRTIVHASRAVVPRMLQAGGGKIVNVGAFAAQRGVADMGAYIASKSAVVRITEAMAAELRDKKINVNCVLPTIIDTPENRKSMPKADPRRWVAPEDLANVIAFLASDAARAVHGAAVPVTGLS